MSFEVKGWCPGALRPMQSGDGLVLRIRPNGGRLTQAQALTVASVSKAHGNGIIDLSIRGNVQLRGLSEATHTPAIDALREVGLVDADPATETRRNIMVTPFADAETDRLADALARALAEADALSELPGKFGFAIDTGKAPVLTHSPADIRLERDRTGALLVRAEGVARGVKVGAGDAVTVLLAMAKWFVAAGGIHEGRGRMGSLTAAGVTPDGALTADCLPAQPAAPALPGNTAQGMLVAFAFGQLNCETLTALAALGDLRVTPWRMVLVEGLQDINALTTVPGAIARPDAPLLRVVACVGKPSCPQALGETRELAKALAPNVRQGERLHVSGCAKGCAWPMTADKTLVATATGYAFVENGTARDTAEIEIMSHRPRDLARLIAEKSEAENDDAL